MGTRRDGASPGCLSLPLLPLLLGSLLSPAAPEALGYQQAVDRAVADFNQRSLYASLFRLLSLDSEPPGLSAEPGPSLSCTPGLGLCFTVEDPDTPKPVSFTVKETVCPKATQLPLEQCDFKENGVVKQCSGTVTLGPASSAFDVSCDRARRFRRTVGLSKFFRKARKKLGKGLQKIKNVLRKYLPRPQYAYA
ncbi:cathelicidin antimicrobial peptide [Heterocephalus glaber]|uniref:Cathelicidin antimicrobial peptide n=1 Tax=Heterocephalus glaber TaxID=10181 RepID=A0AAX6NR02_HETGA|nr:cathelicidin antimicrobial peptide [Heterocephalus glaber]